MSIPVNIVLAKCSDATYDEMINAFTTAEGKKSYSTKVIPAKYGKREVFALQVRLKPESLPKLLARGYGYAKVVL